MVESLLRCECEHTRKTHEGSLNTNDRKVWSCKEKDCKCKRYHPDEDSRKLKEGILIKIGFTISIVSLVAIFGFFAFSIAFDNIMTNYIVGYKYEYKKFENGVEVQLTGDKIPEAGTMLSDIVKMSIGALMGFMVYIFAILYCGSEYEKEMKRLINLG